MLVLSSMNSRLALLARTSVQRLAGNPGDPLQASDERDPSLTPLIAATYPPLSSFQEWLHAWVLNGLFSCKSTEPGWRLCQRVRIIIPLSLTRVLLLVKRTWVLVRSGPASLGPLSVDRRPY